MIDFNRSSPEWAGHDTDILVLGVVAFLQYHVLESQPLFTSLRLAYFYHSNLI